MVSLASLAADIRPEALRCEYREEPLGIDVLKPRLSWNLEAARSARNANQSAYQLLVASTPEDLDHEHGDLWDSGCVKSADSAHIEYQGQPLRSRQNCWWKVRVWDENGKASKWSGPAHWSMGLLDQRDWQAKWIGHFAPGERDEELATAGHLTFADCHWIWFPEGNPRKNAPAGKRYFRRTFDLPSSATIKNARLLLTVDHRYSVFINGQLVRTNYDHGNSWMRAYETEVTAFLRPGRNVLAVEGGSAGNRPAGLIAKLAATYSDNSTFQLVTDASWTTANQETDGWTGTQFEDTSWRAALDLGAIGIEPWGNHWTGWAQQAPSPIFRKSFSVPGPIRSATIYASGLGYHELRLNGKKVGDHVLDPAFTRYDRRALYVTHDVTSELRQGENALGVMLGNGWFNIENFEEWDFLRAPWRDKPIAIVQLEITYRDGTTQVIGSDDSWRAATGPVRFDGIRNGEVYDARRDHLGWDKPGYDDSAWTPATLVSPPKGRLSAQLLPPIRVTQTLRPVKMTEPRPGVFVFDLGQNIAGWAQLKVKGPAGARITVRYGERLTPEGLLDQYPIDCFVYQGPFQTDVYVLKGTGIETWEPRFSYHGFQYIEVSGFPGRASVDSLRGRVIHTDFPSVGSFACSNPLLNRIQEMSRWSFRGNFHGYPTDCPQREKNGWVGDAHIFAETALLNFDTATAYEKWLADFRDERRPDGQAAAIIPTSGWGYGLGPSWDSACILIPWYLYVYSGDKRVLAENYDQMKLYLEFLGTKAKEHIVSYGLGDWMYPKTATPPEITGTGYFFANARILSKAAAVLGETSEAERYAALAEQISTAYVARLYKGNGTFANGSQAAQSCPLWHGLVPDSEREAVARQLLNAVEKQDWHPDVGIIAIKYLLPALSETGQDAAAYRLVTQTTAPSWGDWLNRGATTCWEDWAGEFSRNHYSFGAVSEWFFKYLAGLTPDPEQPGFAHFMVQPRPVGDLTWVRASYHSIRGPISIDWERSHGSFRLKLTIPPNSTATVRVPTTRPESVTESGRPTAKAKGVKFLRTEKDAAVIEVGSGRYLFEAPLP
jgi:alpha-L-rhamnosidase